MKPIGDTSDEMAHRRALTVHHLDLVAALPQINLVRQRALTALAPRPGHRLLDVGGGAGEVARELGNLVGPHGQVDAIDLSPFVIELATSRDDGTPVRYTVGDVTALDFPDQAFDGVRAERVLQQVLDPNQAVRELVRVTRPGGRICLVEPDWSSMRVHGVPGDLIRQVVASITEAGVSMCGSMGRTLAARLSDAGASNVVADPVLVQMDDYEQAVTLLPAFDLRHGLVPGVVPGELAASWFDMVTSAASRGAFGLSVRIWIAAAVR